MNAVPSPCRLVELSVSNLGIIDSLALVLEDGMTALTGETGAGKTMVVGAIEMLLGARADSGAVRPGADEAVVEGRFDLGGDEVVISRVLPADGRSRAYVNGRMATLATLGEVTGPLVDLHGQNSHQSLLAPPVQRLALDVYGGIDTSRLNELRVDVSRLEREIAGLGGDAGARERELDLLRFQLGEIIGAGLDDPDEDDHLDTEETELASMDAHREAVSAAITLIADEAAAEDLLRRALASLAGRAPLAEADQRMREVLTELGDLVAELRSTVDTFHEDPERLAQLRSRRQLLVDLRRKYASAPRLDGTVGLGTLADVIAYGQDCERRVHDLETFEQRASQLERDLVDTRGRLREEEAKVGAARRRVAPALALAVESRLASLAMARARFEVAVPDTDPGDDLRFLLAANPGLPAGPLSRVASGGELARVMLALRLVVAGAPPILVFDEVDAGIGGDAAVSVGRALAELGHDHQVLVVTHLPQVAACADHQVSLRKDQSGEMSVMRAQRLGTEQRVDEIARMLAGSAGGSSMHSAARELLAAGAGEAR